MYELETSLLHQSQRFKYEARTRVYSFESDKAHLLVTFSHRGLSIGWVMNIVESLPRAVGGQ